MEQSLLDSAKIGTTYSSTLGIMFTAGSIAYYCTPQDAYIFADTGCDGTHFCTVHDVYGDMIFVVDPMRYDEYCVWPCAKNYEDFIRLLLSLGDTGVLLSAPDKNAEEFEAFCQKFLSEYDTDERRTARASLAAQYGDLAPMEDAYAYIRGILDTFDFSSIPYSDEYYESAGIPNPNKPDEDGFHFVDNGAVFTSTVEIKTIKEE